MKDQDKSKQQLLEELAESRHRVAVLESAESERQRSEKRYRLLTDAIPQMLWRADANRQTIECNRRWHEYTGQTPEEARGVGWMKALNSDDVARVTERMREAQATGSAYEAEYRMRRASDGNYRWHLSRACPMKDEDGKITGWFGSVTDIDDQKRAEEALRKSEARFRSLFQDSLIGKVVALPTGEFIQANLAFCEFLGYSEQELLGKTIQSITHPEDWEASSNAIRQALTSGTRIPRLEKRYLHKSGRTLWGEVSSTVVCDAEGKPSHIIAQVLDIGKRKQADEELQRQTEELTTINKLGQLINANLSVGQVGEAVIEALIAAVRPDVAMLFRREGDTLVLHSYGPKESTFCHNELPLHRVGECLCGLAVRDGHAVYSTDIGRDPRCTWEECKKAGLRSFAALPLRSGEEIVGVLGLGSLAEYDFRKQSSFLETLASEIALCFQNALLYEQVQVYATELEQQVEERTVELEKANEQLRIFQRFAEAAGQGFAMADFDHRITYANPAMLQLCGEDEIENVLGKNFLSYYPGELRERLDKQFLSGVEQEGHWAGELRFVATTGQPRTVLASGFQIRDDTGNPLSIAVVMTDITELNKAHEALRQAHDELQVIYDGMVDGLLVTDIETLQIVRANGSMCQMLGYSDTELRSLSVSDLHPAEALPHILEKLRAVEEVELIPSETIPVLRKDGSVFYAEIIGKFLTYNGRSCVMGIFRDITERKQAQDALQRQHQTLKHLLQSSDHERQVIAYEIHDGLAQQLAGSIMQFDAFDHLKETKPKQAADAYHAAMTILRQGHFEVRRLISGVRPPILDEEGIVAAVAHLVNEERGKKGPKIEYLSKVEFGRLNPLLENAMYRIVQEALTNACRYSKSKKVQVELIQHGDRIQIEVRDHGVGFKPEDIEENQFGLAGIRERARLLGGTATVESEPGKGTRITVELPVIVAE